MIVLIPLSILAFMISVLVAFGEAWHEKDWPRDTGKYPAIFAITTLLLICSVS